MQGLFDAHADTLTTTCALENCRGQLRLPAEGIFPRGQVLAVCADGVLQKNLLLFYRCRDKVLEAENTVLCSTKEELKKAVRFRKTAALLSIEGVETLGCAAEGLTDAYRAGARAVGLTWNRWHGVCGNCCEYTEVGLTDRGRELAHHADKLGYVLDISHCSDSAAHQLLEGEYRRVYASHSNARSVREHARNVTDSQFCALAERNSLCGLNLYVPFLTPEPTATVEDVLRHMEHFLSLASNAHKILALGCDFDGCDLLPAELENSPALHTLYQQVCNRFSTTFANDLFWNNQYRFWMDCLPGNTVR